MLYLIVLLSVLIIYCSLTNELNENLTDPCNDDLTDNEYLKHMIPHHQVAVDISNKLIKISKNPIMISLCHGIIWQQQYEIQIMEGVMDKLPNEFNQYERNQIKSSNTDLSNYSNKTKLHFYNPKLSQATDYTCDPNFFKPNDHKAHMEGMKLTDKSYLEHMIPHHQVAVDMSNRLLAYTKNIHMIDLATTIIKEQQFEILKMNGMLNDMKSWDYNSSLL